MVNREFYYWCNDAVRGIRYWKDRNRVYIELYEHLQDRYEDFLVKGLPPEEAQRKTLEAMGDPNELAPVLAAIHKPHWAYAAIATRMIATVLLFVCLGQCINFCLDLKFFDRSKETWDPYTGGGESCIAYREPEITKAASGYTFRVERVALWRNYYNEPTDRGEYFDQLYMCLKVTNPLPWMREQQAVRHMWAVDSNGTYYRSFENSFEASGTEEPWVSYRVYRTWIGTYEYELEFQNASGNMQWIELHYDRDGRDLVLRVDLQGGEDR